MTNRVNIAPGLDVRGDGGYIVAPPSLHISGRRYEWDPGCHPDDTPLADVPAWLLAMIKKSRETAGSSSLPADSPIAEGARDSTLTKIAGSLRRQGLSTEEMYPVLSALNNRRCRPPLPDADIEKIARSVARYEPAPDHVEAPRKSFDRTDLGNAARLVAKFGHRIRYSFERKTWLIWTGKTWMIDNTGEVHRLAKDTVRAIYAEAAAAGDDEVAKALAKHAYNSQSAKRIKDMVELAKSEPGIPVSMDAMDADPWLLNVQNGTMDLRTGKLLPHDPGRLLTKIAAAQYISSAQCPLWKSYLNTVTSGNKDLQIFLQKAVGYSLTGNTREECLFFLYGPAQTGKTTFIETIQHLLADYAATAPIETFLVKQNDGAINNDIARLCGARFVCASESEDGKKMAVAKVKSLTGGDRISARFLFGEYFDFTPQFKLFLSSNYKPEIRGDDGGLWRRMRLIPFNVRIPDGERNNDLKGNLLGELPGILKWAVDGCLAWEREGLSPPDEVMTATEGYRAEMDKMAVFLKDICVVFPYATARSSQLYEAYRKWCADSGEVAENRQKFAARLRGRGFIDEHSKFGTLWRGIGLVSETQSKIG